MRPEEATWIRGQLEQYPVESLSPLIELGSSTLEFRRHEKPHIEAEVHAPLRARGVRLVHTDLKPGVGIDISGDIYSESVRAALLAVRAKCLLCCNILEHLDDRESFAKTCAGLLQPGGYMVVTVPRSYPLHLDPIDTYYRPDPSEVARLFPDFELVASEIVSSTTFGEDLRKANAPLLPSAIRDLAKVITLRGGFAASKARAHRWMWLARPYRVSAVVLRKKGAAGAGR